MGIIRGVLAPPLSPPVWVHETAQLEGVVSRLVHEPRIAVDTESNSLHAYPERVCLVQISVPGTDYLIDPLALPDVAPLVPLLQEPRIEKVFHAVEYDLICLKRDFGIRVASLFDTHLAARMLGGAKTGLGDLLAQEFGIRLDKRFQRANWGERPLPPHLLDYARMDTYYLLPLRDRLRGALLAAGLWDEASELLQYVSELQDREVEAEQDGFWRIGNARRLPPVKAAVLRELFLLRETLAREWDRPPFKVIVDETLLAIAQAAPKDLASLRGVPGMTDHLVRRLGNPILGAVVRGRQAPAPTRPAPAYTDQDSILRHERLREWRKQAARKRSIDSDVILPRDMLGLIARQGPRDLQHLRDLMGPLRHRFELYGREILEAIQL
jgi:ribonuclease D